MKKKKVEKSILGNLPSLWLRSRSRSILLLLPLSMSLSPVAVVDVVVVVSLSPIVVVAVVLHSKLLWLRLKSWQSWPKLKPSLDQFEYRPWRSTVKGSGLYDVRKVQGCRYGCRVAVQHSNSHQEQGTLWAIFRTYRNLRIRIPLAIFKGLEFWKIYCQDVKTSCEQEARTYVSQICPDLLPAVFNFFTKSVQIGIRAPTITRGPGTCPLFFFLLSNFIYLQSPWPRPWP